jgi:uncharacterized protein
MPLELRALRGDDTDLFIQATALNQANVPEVGPVDEAKMTSLVAMSWCSLAVVDTGTETGTGSQRLAGFCIVLEPDAPYTSMNYRWFAERYEDFVYLDRVAVHHAYRRRGVATMLYGEVERRAAGRSWFTLEVNVNPPNPPSLAFHHQMGFAEVGQHDTGSYPEYGIDHVRVSLLAKPLT